MGVVRDVKTVSDTASNVWVNNTVIFSAGGSAFSAFSAFQDSNAFLAPEPNSLMLLTIGLGLFAIRGRRPNR